MRTFVMVVGTLAAGLGMQSAAGGDIDQGRAKSVQCIACHGAIGIAPNPTFPSLAGQNAAYLEMQLRHFREGKRYHPVMSPIAESLSDGDIEDFAAYYSSVGPLAGQARDLY